MVVGSNPPAQTWAALHDRQINRQPQRGRETCAADRQTGRQVHGGCSLCGIAFKQKCFLVYSLSIALKRKCSSCWQHQFEHYLLWNLLLVIGAIAFEEKRSNFPKQKQSCLVASDGWWLHIDMSVHYRRKSESYLLLSLICGSFYFEQQNEPKTHNSVSLCIYDDTSTMISFIGPCPCKFRIEINPVKGVIL